MEILTRKMLEKIISTRNPRDVYASDILDADLFEETDQFEVSSLRPMSDLDGYDGVDVLAWNARLQRFIHFGYDNTIDSWLIYEFGCKFCNDCNTVKEFAGFMPMPEYNPAGQN